VSAGRRWDVLGVGDADVDLVIKVDRLPGHDDKVLGHLVGEFPGGVVANFCYSAARMGSITALATVVGDDRNGELALAGLRAVGVDLGPTTIRTGGRTYFCIVLLDTTGEKALTVVETDCMAPAPGELDPELLGEARLVHLMASDVARTAEVAAQAKRRGTLVSLDVEPSTVGDDRVAFRDLLGLVDLAFPNLGGLRAVSDGDVLAGARMLQALGPPLVVVTMGAEGCLVVDGDRAEAVPAFSVPVADTTGAGDCFNGTFVSGYLRGEDPIVCARRAAAAAAMLIQHVGAQAGVPGPGEVDAFLAAAVGPEASNVHGGDDR
jgi:sugar/nucleoside kinase (ribokinase family)